MRHATKRLGQRVLERYGANPLHLLVMLACIGLAGFAALSLIADRPIAVAVWFAGAALAHDILLVPFYSFLDGGLRRRGDRADLPPAPWLNYVRFPAAISALLFLVYAPSILRLSDIYGDTTGLSADGYLVRWLAISGTLFLIAAVAYARRLRRDRRTTQRRGDE